MRTLPMPTPTMTALGAQWRSVVGRVGLASIISAFLITAAVTAYSLAVQGGTLGDVQPVAQLNYLVVAHTLVLTAAFFLPGLLWKGLPPNDRRALHALPVDRRVHELLRVAAGAGLLLSFSVIAHLVGIVLEARLSGAPFVSPSVGVWLSAFIAPLLVYLFGSIAALLTPSATSTLLRVIVYTGVLGLGVTIVGSRVHFVAAAQEMLSQALLTGPVGLWRALGAGASGFIGTTTPVAIALAAWSAVAGMGVYFAAGFARRM